MRSSTWAEVFITLIMTTQSFYVGIRNNMKSQNLFMGPMSSAISNEMPEFEQPRAFDVDFAEAMSKPLPNWYREANAERERLMKEVEKNRERIILEFRKKYEISEEEKRMEQERKWAIIQQRMEEKKNKKDWWKKAVHLFSKDDEEEDIIPQSVITKENWEKFWEEEEKQTGFYLPGFFEVFPELQFKWPNWARRKDGSAVECETDQDCPVPQACCAHPIIAGQQFCCTGWTQRVMVPAYATQEAYYDTRPVSPTPGGHGTSGY